MNVYIVISEFFGEKNIERVYEKEQKAIDFCDMMNNETLGFYYYTKQKVRS